jgi:hypothetical protein
MTIYFHKHFDFFMQYVTELMINGFATTAHKSFPFEQCDLRSIYRKEAVYFAICRCIGLLRITELNAVSKILILSSEFIVLFVVMCNSNKFRSLIYVGKR